MHQPGQLHNHAHQQQEHIGGGVGLLMEAADEVTAVAEAADQKDLKVPGAGEAAGLRAAVQRMIGRRAVEFGSPHDSQEWKSNLPILTLILEDAAAQAAAGDEATGQPEDRQGGRNGSGSGHGNGNGVAHCRGSGRVNINLEVRI